MTEPTQGVHIRRIMYASGSQPLDPYLYDDDYDPNPDVNVLDPVMQYNGLWNITGYVWDGTRQVVAPDEPDPVGDALRAEMIAYWKFEEASGTRVDATGNGHDGTPTNAPDNITGKVGNALRLVRESSQKITVADHADLRNTGNLYIFGWAKITEAADNETYYGATLIEKVDPINGYYEFELYYYKPLGTNQFAFYITSNEANDGGAVDSPEILIGDYYFIDVYYDASTRELGIAINNGEFTTSTISGVLGPDVTTDPVVLGADVGSPAAWLASAVLDEFGFMKPATVPITQEQRDYLYNSGNGRTLYS